MSDLMLVPGAIQKGEELFVVVGKSEYRVDIEEIHVSKQQVKDGVKYWHLILHATGNKGNFDGSYFHFFFFENNYAKGVALPVNFCAPDVAITMSGSWSVSGMNMRTHPPLPPMLSSNIDFPDWLSDPVHIERR